MLTNKVSSVAVIYIVSGSKALNFPRCEGATTTPDFGYVVTRVVSHGRHILEGHFPPFRLLLEKITSPVISQ